MGVLWARARLGYGALHDGRMAEAQPILVEAIENFCADQNKNGLAFALDKMASLYVATNRLETATRKEIGDPRPRIAQADLDRDISVIIAQIGSSAFEAAYDSGQGITLYSDSAATPCGEETLSLQSQSASFTFDGVPCSP